MWNFDSGSNKQGGPAPHPWVVAQANYMLSHPWDVALWSTWWWVTYLNTLQSMGIDMRAITDACWPEAYYKSLDIGMAESWFGPDMAEILRSARPGRQPSQPAAGSPR